MTKKILNQAKENAVGDRLKLAADRIRQSRKVPDTVICDAIGDSAWFREYCNICLQQPIANSFLGCILFGWQLCEEYKKLFESNEVIYRA
jgi:hypothetical protein